MEKMTLKEAREKFTIIKVHAPQLGEDLTPFFELLNMSCPKGNDGRCGSCKSFRGIMTGERWSDSSLYVF